MHPERRRLGSWDIDLDDFLGVLVPGRYRDAVATREDLFRPPARKQGIFD